MPRKDSLNDSEFCALSAETKLYMNFSAVR